MNLIAVGEEYHTYRTNKMVLEEPERKRGKNVHTRPVVLSSSLPVLPGYGTAQS